MFDNPDIAAGNGGERRDGSPSLLIGTLPHDLQINQGGTIRTVTPTKSLPTVQTAETKKENADILEMNDESSLGTLLRQN